LSRFQRVRDNLRHAYDSGRESVRQARADEAAAGEPEADDFELPPRPPEVVHDSTVSLDDAEVPHSLRIAAAWSWRLIVVGVVGWALLHFIGIVSFVVIPLAIALLLSALLAPAVGWLLRLHLNRSLATFLVLIFGLAVIAGTLTLVISQFIDGAFAHWCQHHGIGHRFGSVGKYGSIAVIERVMRTLKSEFARRLVLVSFRRAEFARELSLWDLDVGYESGRKHLPVIALRRVV